MSNQKNSNGCLQIVFLALGLFMLFRLFETVAQPFMVLGFNTSFYLDNLMQGKLVSPILGWAIFGLFLGAIAGTLIAIKKYKLSRLLLCYPIGALLLVLGMLAIVNKPAAYPTEYRFFKDPNQQQEPENESTITHFRLTSDLNVRTRPNLNSTVAFTLRKNEEVELVDRNHFDNRGVEWIRIRNAKGIGYVNAKYLTRSR